MNIKIFHNPRCSKSREALEFLNNKGINPEVILYLENFLSEETIKNLLKMLKISAREIMRKKEPEYKEQDLSNPNLTEEQLIKAIAKTPKLLERPIVINGNKAVIARPLENILQIL
jgi:arsenate reductase